MRIVIDARESGTSTGRYVDKLIEYLHRLKPDFEIIVITKSHRLDYLKSVAPSFNILESTFREFTFGEQLGLAHQIHGLKPDLVHFTMTQQPVLLSGRCITTIHDLTTARFVNPAKNHALFVFKQLIYKWVIRKAARKSIFIITGSQFVKSDVAQYAKIDPTKIVVTYEAADKITVSAEPVKNLAGEKFIMYVGRPLPHKNLERLLEAFTIIQQTNPGLKLVLAGKKDALFEKLEKTVQKTGIGGVVFADYVTEGQLRWLYENTAAYVFPSLSEGFGLPGLEAMAHDAPVVSSNATCLPEIYGKAAHYFDPLAVDDMASKISEVLDNSKLRTNLIAAGNKQAAKYSWQRMAEQTLEVYNQALRD